MILLKHKNNLDVCYSIISCTEENGILKLSVLPYNLGQDGVSYLIGIEYRTNFIIHRDSPHWYIEAEPITANFRNLPWATKLSEFPIDKLIKS